MCASLTGPQALLSDGHTLDFFFWLSLSELDEIMAKCNASGDDSKRLQTYLDFLKAYYGELIAVFCCGRLVLCVCVCVSPVRLADGVATSMGRVYGCGKLCQCGEMLHVPLAQEVQ